MRNADATSAPRNKPYLVATIEKFPGVRIPLLSDEECRARGIDKPTLPIFAHMTKEERLNALQPLITLLAEQSARDILDEEALSLAEPRKLHTRAHHRPEFPMVKARKQKKRSINPWTAADVKNLRRHARRTPVPRIARELKRSESAVRQKASSLGVSLRLR
jgi:hypothetical protein